MPIRPRSTARTVPRAGADRPLARDRVLAGASRRWQGGRVRLLADVAVPAGLWAAWNVGIAVAAARVPPAWLAVGRDGAARPPFVPGLPARLGVRRWKHLLPDASAVVPGATAKRRLGPADRASLVRFAADARRGEVVHWLSLAFVVPCLAWWPPVVVVPMLAVAVVINVPCIIALRDTRARLARVLGRARPTAGAAPPGASARRLAGAPDG
jgi:glycosyl-4,4'-diaponeurosporenoate acyltransferase